MQNNNFNYIIKNMEGGTGFEPVNGDFADHSVSLFATRPSIFILSKDNYINFHPLLQDRAYLKFKSVTLL